MVDGPGDSRPKTGGTFKWLVIGLLTAVVFVGIGVYLLVPERSSPPFPTSIGMPEGVTLVSVKTSGSPSCAGGLCETTTYLFASPAGLQSLCSDVVTAVEQWSGADLTPIEGGDCGASGTAQGWRISVGIYRPTDLAPPQSRIVVTTTKQ